MADVIRPISASTWSCSLKQGNTMVASRPATASMGEWASTAAVTADFPRPRNHARWNRHHAETTMISRTDAGPGLRTDAPGDRSRDDENPPKRTLDATARPHE